MAIKCKIGTRLTRGGNERESGQEVAGTETQGTQNIATPFDPLCHLITFSDYPKDLFIVSATVVLVLHRVTTISSSSTSVERLYKAVARRVGVGPAASPGSGCGRVPFQNNFIDHK